MKQMKNGGRARKQEIWVFYFIIPICNSESPAFTYILKVVLTEHTGIMGKLLPQGYIRV
jgi:hypothetical protein